MAVFSLVWFIMSKPDVNGLRTSAKAFAWLEL